RAVPPKLLHPLEALPLKSDVADGEHLVHQEKARLRRNGHGEPEPDGHSGRIELHGRVDEVLHLRKSDDVVEPAVELGSGHAEDGSVDVDVLPARELLVEAHTEPQQRSQTAPDLHDAFGRGGHAGEHREEGGLAGAVASDDADALARLHLEVDVANGPQPSSAVTPDELRQALDERRRVLVLDVALADVGHAHGAGLVLHSRSTITRSKRLKSRAANTP